MQRQRRKLTVEDRVASICGGKMAAAGDRAGAWPLAQRDQYGDRARPGTGGNYAAGSAQAAVGRSGRRARLAPDSPLFAEVAKLLRLQWSPEQIAGRRKRLEDGMEVSSGLRCRKAIPGDLCRAAR